MTTALQRTSLGELGYSPLAATSLGELGVTLAIDLPEFGPGGGSSKKRHGPSARQIQIQQQIEEENALMLAVVKAFLKMVD